MKLPYVQHGHRHGAFGSDPVPDIFIPPVWQDISSGVAVTRGDALESNPDITAAASMAFAGAIGGLEVVWMNIVLGASVGSGISRYVIDLFLGQPPGSGYGSVVGFGTFIQSTIPWPCKMVQGITPGEWYVVWDGADDYQDFLGPVDTTSPHNQPADFSSGDTLFNGVIVGALP